MFKVFLPPWGSLPLSPPLVLLYGGGWGWLQPLLLQEVYPEHSCSHQTPFTLITMSTWYMPGSGPSTEDAEMDKTLSSNESS